MCTNARGVRSRDKNLKVFDPELLTKKRIKHTQKCTRIYMPYSCLKNYVQVKTTHAKLKVDERNDGLIGKESDGSVRNRSQQMQ